MKPLRLVAVASVLSMLVALSVHSRAAGRPMPSEGQRPTPPPGVYVGGRDGVTNPRVIRQVKPAYTPDAARARVEGVVVVSCVVQPDGTVSDVRVIKSLDRVFGLDDEAVKAAKQWRFVPGTKDGGAVPVLVSIELNFALRDRPGQSLRPPSLGWPDAFVAGTQTDVSGAEDWTDEVSEDSDVRVRFWYPKRWTFRRGVSPRRWFGVQDGLRVVIVDRPRPAAAPIPDPLNTLQMDRLRETITRSLAARQSSAVLGATGQVHAADHLWFWYALWVPATDPTFPSDAAERLAQSVDGATAWTFMASVGGKGLTVSCYAIRPRGTSDADVNGQMRDAGARFRAMLERMTIELPRTPSGPR